MRTSFILKLMTLYNSLIVLLALSKCIINLKNKQNHKNQMSSFEKLLANSTNRSSAVKNIILSQESSRFTPLQPSEHHNQYIRTKNCLIHNSPNDQEIVQTFQQLQHKYDQVSKITKQANKQKQMMTMLFDKILKIQMGEEAKLKKRFRRKKNQIQSKFLCRMPECNKMYSSSTSMARHAKLKHASYKFQPPQHDYQIPPQPNLGQSSEIEKRDETRSNLKSLLGDKDDGEDADNFDYQEGSDALNSQEYGQIQVEEPN